MNPLLLPPGLRDAPIDRPELLEHLGKYRWVSGKTSKVSHLTPAERDEYRRKTGDDDFKGYIFQKNANIVTPDNSISVHQREKISIDHIWLTFYATDTFEMYQRIRGLHKIILYQRTNGSLSIGADRVKWTHPDKDIEKGFSQVEALGESAFFDYMDELAVRMSTGDLGSCTAEDKAHVLNILCDSAIDMVMDGRMSLWFENEATFKNCIPDWKTEWLLTAGVTGSFNRKGRRTRPRFKAVPGIRHPSKKKVNALQKKANNGGFG